MKYILDANGLDKGPEVVIAAGKRAVKEGMDITIIGKESIRDQVNMSGCKFMLATEEISTEEKNPAFAIRKYKDSTITKGLYALKNGEFDAFVSGGSTGAVLAGGTLIVGRIPGVKRSALTIPIPNVNGKLSYLLDAGANVECTPDMLYEFAVLASNYVKSAKGIENPSVMLINNGIEEEKGSSLTKEAYQLLKNSNLNFKGNLEGRYIFDGQSDIIVTDGFSGNLILKCLEGEFIFINHLIKKSAMENFFNKIAMLILKKSFKRNFSVLDSNQYGGVPLLGLKKVVIKAHGSSDECAFYNSILAARDAHESGMIESITNIFAKEA
ncbi:MAG: phosphate acyltransferase PlsX [Ezakiella sp.]|nr:phosphate acyltransferase PlsX [Ezakiella sp.]